MAEDPACMRIRSSSFQFEVDYDQTKNAPIGDFICSSTFTAGGCDWVLYYYPQGKAPENQGSHVLVFIGLKGNVKEIVAEFAFKAFDKTKGVFVSLDSARTCTFDKDHMWGIYKLIARDTIEQTYCDNGIITFCCYINVVNGPKAINNYPGGLCEHMAKLQEKGEKFDVNFVVEGETIPAHKLVLAARSQVFKEKFYGLATEPDVIEVDDMTANAFKDLLHFIYADQLVSTRDVLSVEYQDLLVAANRYGLEKLSLLCEEELLKNISVGTVLKTLIFADKHDFARLKRKCLKFATDRKNFPEIVLSQDYGYLHNEVPELFATLKRSFIEKNVTGKQLTGGGSK